MIVQARKQAINQRTKPVINQRSNVHEWSEWSAAPGRVGGDAVIDRIGTTKWRTSTRVPVLYILTVESRYFVL